MKKQPILLLAMAIMAFCIRLPSDASAARVVTWGSMATPGTALEDITSIAAGWSYGLALKSDGSVVGWGYNDSGAATPPAGSDFMAIAAGGSHSLALKSDGSIVGWGENSVGQATPPDGNDFVAIAAGGYHSLALKSDGSIVGWGLNDYNQATPPAGNDFVAISAGAGYGIALVRTTYYVDGVNGDDNNDGLSPQTAFATIQRGIDIAGMDTVLVQPGLYTEQIDFLGKAITVKGNNGAAVIDGDNDFAVSFYYGEGHDSILKNFIIRNSFIGIFIARSSPTISNVTVVDNEYGIDAYAGAEPNISNSIICSNTNSDLFQCQTQYSCIGSGDEGLGNICEDPLFFDPDNDDYHLKSFGWRWDVDANDWTYDDVTSECIDAGNPGSALGDELMTVPADSTNRWGENIRINMGAYGGTAEASMPPPDWYNIADMTNDKAVDIEDLLVLAGLWLDTYLDTGPGLPADLNRDKAVNLQDFSILCKNWLWD